jgi:hypothetical protein
MLIPTILIAMLLLVPIVSAATVTVVTDTNVYYGGDTMTVSGMAPINQPVTISLINPNNVLAAVAQTTADSDGNYLIVAFTFPSAATTLFKAGTYTVKAYSAGTSAETLVTFGIGAPPTTPTTIPPTISGEIAIQMDVGSTYEAGEIAAWTILTTVGGVPTTVTTMTCQLYEPGATTPISLAPTSIGVGLYRATYTPTEPGAYALVVIAEHGGYNGAAIKGFKLDVSTAQIMTKLDSVQNTIFRSTESILSALTPISDNMNSLNNLATTEFSALHSHLSAQDSTMKVVLESINTVSSNMGSISSSMIDGFNSVQETIVGTESRVTAYIKDNADYLSKVVEGSTSTIKGDIEAAKSEVAYLMQKSSADIVPFLMAIAILVIISLILSAIAAIRTLRE